MTYTDADDLDFATIERHAYVEGNTTLAMLAAAAHDRALEVEQVREELEKDLAKETERSESAEEALRTLKEQVRTALEDVDRVLADCKRISGRKELEAALQAVYNATEEV